MPTNEERTEWAFHALMEYQKAKGETQEVSNESIVDLMTDLLHLAESEGIVPEGVIRVAVDHHSHETGRV